MIFELVEDFRQAVEHMPREHALYGRIALLREAMLGSIAGLAERPRCLTQTLTNRMRRRPVSAAARELINSGEALLADLDWWLCADDGIVETHQWEGIVAVSPRRGLVHCVRGDRQIVDCRMDTQQIIGVHCAPTETFTPPAVCPSDGRVAVVGTDGIVYTNDGVEPVALRKRSNCFAGLGDGFVGIDEQANLIYWDRSTDEPIRLAGEMPPRGCSASINGGGDAALVIAGDRLETQRLLFIYWRPGDEPICQTWSGDGRIVNAACLDDRAKLLVFATADRQLSAVDLESGRVLDTISLARSPGRPLGELTHCACVKSADGERVVFADMDGVVGLWDTHVGLIRRVGRFRSIESPGRLVCLAWLADGQRFVAATRNTLRVISLDEQIDVDASAASVAVTDCAVGRDGWLTLVQEKAQRVTWIRNGVVQETFYHSAFRPRSVASNGADGEVLVGGRGSLLLLRPGCKPGRDDGLDIFDRPVVAVLPEDARTAAAVCETGEIKLVRLADEWVNPVRPPTHHWQQAGACRLNNGRDIVCWGRSIADEGASRVYVVCTDGRIEEIFSGRDLVVDVACTRTGPLIHVAVDGEVIAYARNGGRWESVMRRSMSVIAMASHGDAHLAVAPTERTWLELWSSCESLKTVAMCHTPVSVKCISTAGNAIVLGTQDGRYVLLTVYHQRRPKA